MKRFQWTVFLAVAMALCSAGPLVAGSVKLVAVNGAPLPAGTATTNYRWVDHVWTATTKYAFKGLTPGRTYLLYGSSNTYWTPDVRIAAITVLADGTAKGSETYLFPFDPGFVNSWDGYFVVDGLTGNIVMMSH